VDSLIDDSIVREIDREGFIDKVYGKGNWDKALSTLRR
jgi:hypothetical protein